MRYVLSTLVDRELQSRVLEGAERHTHFVSNSWPPDFDTWRTNFDLSSENKPYIERQAELEEELDVVGLDVVESFMGGPDADENSPRIDKLRQVCNGSNSAPSQGAQDQTGIAPSSSAWLDEKSLEGGVVRSRAGGGYLAPSDLYQELKKQVGHSGTLPSVQSHRKLIA